VEWKRRTKVSIGWNRVPFHLGDVISISGVGVGPAAAASAAATSTTAAGL